MSINLLLEQVKTQSQLVIPEGWGQGRATYGGLVGSLLLSHLTAKLGDVFGARVLRSATISFIGAVNPGEIQFTTEIFRSGKSVTQAEARLLQNGEVMAILLASFGSPRVSGIDIPAQHSAPEYKGPDQSVKFPYIAGLTPEFLQKVDARQSQGELPYTGSDVPDFGGWMRWNDEFPQMTVAHLLGLVDVWPPSVLSMLKGPANASTLSWNIEFLSHAFEQSSKNWWQYQVATDLAKDGYAHAEAHIWDDNKNLVAISRQVSTVFA